MQRQKKEKKIEIWDRRPWPGSGDTDESKLYAAVGRSLSAWERYESRLAFLFAQFTGASIINPAIRAYCAIRTFEGRKEMLKAASKQYFYGFGIGEDHQLVINLKDVLRHADKFSQRRNDIAHGVVDSYIVNGASAGSAVHVVGEYALFPTYGSAQSRDEAGIPEYCYTSAELDYFSDQFQTLHKPAHILAAEISVVTNAALHTPMNASSRKSPPPVRM